MDRIAHKLHCNKRKDWREEEAALSVLSGSDLEDAYSELFRRKKECTCGGVEVIEKFTGFNKNISIADSQYDMWREAIRLYNKSDYTDVGITNLTQKYIIKLRKHG